MKQFNDLYNSFPLWGIMGAVWLFGITSCSVNRKATVKEHSLQTDSLSYTRNDSLQFTHLLQSATHQTLQLEHITLSRPDSLGRQHIESISLLTTNTQQQQTEQTQETATSHTKEQHQTQTLTNTEQQTHTKRNNPYHWVIIGVVLLFVVGRMLWVWKR